MDETKFSDTVKEILENSPGLRDRPATIEHGTIYLNAAACPACDEILISASRHDYRECKCGNAVDGGLEYLRRVGNLIELSIGPDNLMDVLRLMKEHAQ